MSAKLLALFLSLISLISLTFNIFFYQKIQSENQVMEVVDGDTFQLKSGKRVRLMGVDAPEYDRCGGQEAKNRLNQLVYGKQVILKEETQEAYGRSLALVYLGKQFVNKIMMAEGWGRADYRKNTQRDVLTQAFHQAQAEHLGIFSELCRNQDPFNPHCLIKGNIDKATYEKFYHLPNCKHYKEIILDADMGEKYFCTEAEAQAAGFTKAAGCP